jgi:RNA polymerase sigma factor (sigma-70 family)
MLHESNQTMSESPKAAKPAADVSEPLESLVAAGLRELQEENASGPALRMLSEGLIGPIERHLESRWSGLEDWQATASEALARILAKLDAYDSQKGSLIGWAIGIANNTAKSAYRRQTAEENKAETSYQSKHRQRYHIDSPLSESQHDALCEAILLLPEADHHLLYLHFIEGHTLADAAKELKITEDLARQKKKRILKALEAVRIATSNTTEA